MQNDKPETTGSAHTPGPWTAEAEYEDRDPTYVHHYGCPIADCDGGRTIAEGIANARLIAAAPKMLAALKDCADDLEALVEHHYEKTKDYPSEQRRYERDIAPVRTARAVIREATGSP